MEQGAGSSPQRVRPNGGQGALEEDSEKLKP